MIALRKRKRGEERQPKTLVLLVSAAVLLILTAVAAGCGGGEETTTTTAVATETTAGGTETTTGGAETSTTQTAERETFVIRTASQSAEGSWPAVHSELPWEDAVAEATGGAVTFEHYYSNTLVATPDMWQAVGAGVADLAYIPHTAYPGMTPLSDVITLPFLPFESSAQASGILWKLYEEFPSIRGEWQPHKVNYFVVGVCNHIAGNRLFKVMNDFKGAKIRPTGGTLAPKQLELLGASSVSLPGSEVYLNLSQRVIDAVVSQWDFTIGFRFYEVVKNFTYVPMTAFIISNVMNQDLFNSMPSDVQQAIDSVSGLARGEVSGDAQFDALYDRALEVIREQGIEIVEYTVPPEEVEKWTEVAGTPLWEQWVVDLNAAGYSEAQQILDRVFELIETYHPAIEQ